jgi:hypothetical protein
MGEEVLQLLSTRASQGVKTSKDTVLQGLWILFQGISPLMRKRAIKPYSMCLKSLSEPKEARTANP